MTAPPVLFTNLRRMDSVPKVELFGGSEVKSRTRFGGLIAATFASRKLATIKPLRRIGLERFSGPGEPSRCPAPADVPLVSTKMKSAALLFGVDRQTSGWTSAESGDASAFATSISVERIVNIEQVVYRGIAGSFLISRVRFRS